MTTEAELVTEIEGENRGDDAVVDAERDVATAEEDFAANVERRESVTTEAQLVDEIDQECAA